MGTKRDAVLESALALSDEERAWLAAELLSSLGPDLDEMSDDDLAAELDRRLDECRRDPSASVSWAELKDRG